MRPRAAADARRFAALDGWRGLLAMMVALFHLNAMTHAYDLTRNGWASVDFFFVLSGFVLMSGFSGRLTGAPAFGRFAARRLARLYPLHLATLAVLVALVGWAAIEGDDAAFTGPYSLTGLWQCVALVQGFTIHALAWNFPSWSISIEFWASLLMGGALTMFGRRSWIAFGVLTLALVTLLALLGEPGGPATDGAGALLKAAHYLLAFFIGTLLFGLFTRIEGRGFAPPPWVEVAATVGLGLTFLFADRIPPTLLILLFAMVILVFAFEAGPVSIWLKTKPLQAAGGWSYSIYLVHPLWTILVFKAVKAASVALGQAAASDGAGDRLILGGPFAMDLAAFACLALVLATAALTCRFIETPGRRLIPRTPRAGSAS